MKYLRLYFQNVKYESSLLLLTASSAVCFFHLKIKSSFVYYLLFFALISNLWVINGSQDAIHVLLQKFPHAPFS